MRRAILISLGIVALVTGCGGGGSEPGGERNSGGEKRTVRTIQYLFQQDGTGSLLTFTTSPSLAT